VQDRRRTQPLARVEKIQASELRAYDGQIGSNPWCSRSLLDARFGSSVGGIVSELSTIQPNLTVCGFQNVRLVSRLAGMVHNYTLGMNPPRTLPLFDSGEQPASWNERMSPGEYAVHYSSFDSSALQTGPTCTILASLADAEEYAKAQVALKPTLRCRIYDDRDSLARPSSNFGDNNT
jgi:hypothetical protein